MNTTSLTSAELDQLDEILLKYGNDDSILSVSELDGFLTGIVSAPEAIMPSVWLPILWGGKGREPNWENEAELQHFMALVMGLMNENVSLLMDAPGEYSALFSVNENGDVFIVEDWCFGYMTAVALANWPELPEELDVWLDAISMHGLEENFEILTALTLDEHQITVADIEPAVRKLHAYWLAQRSVDGVQTHAPFIANPSVGRNEPCPCGSGKKFKRCCLH
jgi:uncharacterized protein